LMAVPDTATAHFMVELHRAMRSGLSPGKALAATRSGENARLAAAFVCFGRDDGSAVEPRRRDGVGAGTDH
jgi:hypothetical protein